MSNAVRLSLAVDGDTSDAVTAFDKVGAAAKGMADDVDKAAADADSGMSKFGESADGAGSSAATAAGAFGDLGGALSLVPGPLGKLGAGMEAAAPAIQGVTGATDLLSLATNSSIVVKVKDTAATIAHTVQQKAASVATKAWAATQWLLNAAMTASPIGLIVAGVVLLGAAIFIAYKKSETFRNIVKKLGEAAKAVFSGIVAYVKTVIGIYQTLWTVAKSVATGIKDAFTRAWDKVKGALGWNPVPVLRRAWSGIKDVLTKPFEDAWELIKDIFGPGGKISGIGDSAMGALSSAINNVIDAINAMIRAFNKLPGGDIPQIPHVGSASSSSRAGVSAMARTPRVGLPAGGTGGNVNITIQGAVDPYGTARQIRRILARGAVISGRVTP